jgi:hypothetical protein
MRAPNTIIRLYRDRKAKYMPLHDKMREISDIYNGRATVDLPDMERDSDVPIPNLLQQGVDQMAGRISSVIPQATFSSAKPGTRKYDRLAQNAGQVVTGWWQADKVPLKQKTRARRLVAYAMAPTVIRWDYKEHRPVWQVKHPLETLPSLDLVPGQVSPTDCIFTYRRTVGWLRANGYGAHVMALAGDDATNDTSLTLIEYMDGDSTVLMAVGNYQQNWYTRDTIGLPVVWEDGNTKGVVLEAYDNMAGDDLPFTIPTRLTLDDMTGQFDGMVGLYYMQAKLMALDVIAVEKGIFPDTYLVSRPGEVGRFLEGPHDGRTGLVNIISGGDIRTEQTAPGYQTNPTIDRLERAQRVTSGIPAEFGGESGSNIRTGRRGDAVLSATIDFPIAEAQEIFAAAFEEENEAAIAMAKRIDGDTQRTIFVGTGNNRRPVTYKANEVFEHEEHVVSYPAAGTDVNSLVIALGQRVGLGYMSKRTAATLDPFIDNAEAEHDAVIAEGLEQALMAGIQQQASQGAIPPLTLSKIMMLVRDDKMELAEAMEQVTQDALKEQQAAQAQAGPPATPDAAAAGGAVQAMAGMSPIPGAPQGTQDLGALLGSLRRPNMTIVPDRRVAQGAM